MKLNLKNPIVFFDLETTGTNINTDRIVEICYLKVYPNGNEEAKTLRINPEMHIPEASSAVHGIYDADVADCPTFKEVAKNIARDIEGCDLAGFNSNRFDIPVLAEEFLRAGVDIDMSKRKFVDVQVIFHKMEQRTLSAAYKFYCEKNLEDAHTAEADTRATYEVLKAQLDRYPDLLARRRALVARYERNLADAPVQLVRHYTDRGNSSGHLMLTRIDGAAPAQRNAVIDALAERGVASNVHYKPLPLLTAYRNLGFKIEDYPNAYAQFANEVTLPLHTKLTDEDVDYVCDAYRDAIRQVMGR